MLARALFYPTLTYNIVLEKLSCRQWYSRIDETVILGALPFRGMTHKLVEDEDVRGVVTMNEDYELKHFVNTDTEWDTVGVTRLQLSTVDIFATPTQGQVHAGVAFIMEQACHGHSVYVHCKAGRTRSATLVACYLIKKHLWTPEEAVEFIRAKRPHILLRKPQWNTIKTFYADISSTSTSSPLTS
ncbi:Phosphatidylglycerophosphatase and protein-tyrosine phosphatase 1 [Lamellibrachia satsuma]|nr:Phosphatidylglycerophosphatase and protein-tyrosine phosphatase 1 [Lamellibrachia satsuma]